MNIILRSRPLDFKVGDQIMSDEISLLHDFKTSILFKENHLIILKIFIN